MILVTGVTGFIGKPLISALVENYGQDSVVALVSDPISNCRFILHNNYQFSENYFVSAGLDKIETIIHVGSFTPKSRAEANDWKGSNSNIFSTSALLNSQFPNLRRFIFFSTADIYEAEETITENSRINPISLYAHSKWYSEQMVSAWATRNKIQSIILRLGHIYGPGENRYEKIIPATMKKILLGENIQIIGDGNENRSFLFVNDVIDFIINLLNSQFNYQIVNLASAYKITIQELINEIIKISDRQCVIEQLMSDRKIRNLSFDNSRMMSVLKRDEMPFEEGLKIEWQFMKGLYS